MADAPKLVGTDRLKDAYPKINQAIDKANQASTDSAEALNTANSVQTQFNGVVLEGAIDPETAQARVNARGESYSTLKERIDSLDIDFLERGANVKWFGAVGDGIEDDTLAIQEALNTETMVIIPSGDYLVKDLTLNPGQQLFIFGDLHYASSNSGSMISATSVEGVGVYGFGGSLNGNASDTSTGLTLMTVTNSIVKGLKVTGFLNKGISLSDCDGVVVAENKISGSTGPTGAAISVFGSSCFRCNIVNNVANGSRIGIAANGGGYHTINSNTCNSNSYAGIMLDGIVTGSGDGTKHSSVKGNIVTNCTNTGYGGIYLGNGCSYNDISDNVSASNARSGIRLSTGATNQQYGNIVSNNVLKANAYSGIEMSYSYQTIISGNSIFNNSQRGIAASYSDNSKIFGNMIRGNGQQGILWQSANSSLNDNQVIGNDKGIEIAFGGSTPNGNTLIGNDVTGNTTNNLVLAGTNKLENNIGYVNKNRGIASGILSGGTIPHGLAGDPSVSPYGNVSVQAKGTSSSGPSNVRVNTDGTNITVYYQGTGPFDFYWSASLGSVM